MSKEVEEELFTPRGELHFSYWRAFTWMGGQYVERDAADDRQILWRVVLSRSGVVFMKDDIERPVTIIFDAPVQSDGLQQLSRRQTLGQGDIMDHCPRLAAGLAPLALDASKCNETGEISGLGRRDKAGPPPLETIMAALAFFVKGAVAARVGLLERRDRARACSGPLFPLVSMRNARLARARPRPFSGDNAARRR